MVKVKPVQNGRTTRMSFSRINEVIGMPNLIEIQKNSYNWFLEEGLHEVFHDIAAIEDYTGNLVLEFVDYRLDENPKYTIKECKERDATYAAPLYVTARLFNKQTGEVKEQEIFMGDFPLMTDSGTFIIQRCRACHRLPVGSFSRRVSTAPARTRTGKDLFTATMNPNRGAWLEYETDSHDVFYVRIDKNRKLPVTTLICVPWACPPMSRSSSSSAIPSRRSTPLSRRTSPTTPRKACWRSTASCAPASPRRSRAPASHLNDLFFDPRRYDLARFGRYKMNNKLALARRIAGYRAAEDIIAPADRRAAGRQGREDQPWPRPTTSITPVLPASPFSWRRRARSHAVIVISNGCVERPALLQLRCRGRGRHQRACQLRRDLARSSTATSDVEEQKELLRQNHDVLISRTRHRR